MFSPLTNNDLSISPLPGIASQNVSPLALTETRLRTEDRLNELSIEPVRLVEVTPDILRKLGVIYASCFSAPPWNERWSNEQAERVCQEYLRAGSDFLIARLNEEMLGFIVGKPLSDASDAQELAKLAKSSSDVAKLYYLADFAVSPSMQGKGVGKRLLESLRPLATRTSCAGIVTRTRFNNDRAIRAFGSCGFTKVGEIVAETGGVSSTRFVFERRL